ncbi:MAG: hypothetical protein ACREU7_11085, partial [Burkholderiales bacterium]
LRTAYSNANPNRAAYIDFEVTEGALNLPFSAPISVFNVEWSSYLNTNVHAASAAHAVNEYEVIGVADLTEAWATAEHVPISVEG